MLNAQEKDPGQEELDLLNESAEQIEDKQEKQDQQEPDPAEVIKKLQQQIADKDADIKAERERAKRLESDHNEVVKKAHITAEEAISAREKMVETAIQSAETEIDSLDNLLAAALEEGNSKEAVSITKKLNEAGYKKMRLVETQEQIKAYKEHQKNLPKGHEYRNNGRSQETDDWIERNPRFKTDPEFKADAISAHSAAVERGIRPDSPAYFRFIDQRMAVLYPEDKADLGDEEQAASPTPKRSVTNYAAPPTRTGNGMSASQRKAPLTQAEKEAADMNGLTEDEYRKYRDDLKKEGRIQ